MKQDGVVIPQMKDVIIQQFYYVLIMKTFKLDAMIKMVIDKIINFDTIGRRIYSKDNY